MKPLPDFPAETLLARVTASGLRGRGGGWFPVGRKWAAVRAEGGRGVVVANGAEGEPGSFKDRYTMLGQADDVARGLALAARAVGATEGYVFLKGSFDGPAAAMQEALGRQQVEGFRVEIRRGDDSYITGEETAAIEVLEGRRPWPRPKPPRPSAVGFQGRPTLVQNVETLARVESAVSAPEDYGRGETTTVTLWGDVRRPGVYTVGLGTPLRRVIEELGGGAPDGVGLVFPGGPAGPPLLPDQLDTPLDPDALRAAGSALGTAAVLVVGSSACPLAAVVSAASFFAREHCGQCPPCVVGTANLHRIVQGLETGKGKARDRSDLDEVAGFMSDHGYCAHGRTAAAVAQGSLRLLAGEVEDHVRAGGCPDPGRRHPDPFAPGSEERVAVEAAVAAQLS